MMISGSGLLFLGHHVYVAVLSNCLIMHLMALYALAGEEAECATGYVAVAGLTIAIMRGFVDLQYLSRSWSADKVCTS